MCVALADSFNTSSSVSRQTAAFPEQGEWIAIDPSEKTVPTCIRPNVAIVSPLSSVLQSSETYSLLTYSLTYCCAIVSTPSSSSSLFAATSSTPVPDPVPLVSPSLDPSVVATWVDGSPTWVVLLGALLLRGAGPLTSRRSLTCCLRSRWASAACVSSEGFCFMFHAHFELLLQALSGFGVPFARVM